MCKLGLPKDHISWGASLNICIHVQAFNGKKWEKFNSEKVASLAYARIQGRSALVAHFQNSSLMNEDKRCRPILFDPEGADTGNEVKDENFPGIIQKGSFMCWMYASRNHMV